MATILKFTFILLGSLFLHSLPLLAQKAVLNSDNSNSKSQLSSPEEQAALLGAPEEPTSNRRTLFSAKDIQGSGGSVFLGYSGQLENVLSKDGSIEKIRNNFAFGGNFFFLLNNTLRLGIEGAIIRPVSVGDPLGYALGPLVEMLIRLDPALLEFGLSAGYGEYKDKPYFTLFPKIAAGLRLTEELAISFSVGYLIFINSESFSRPRAILEQSHPFLGCFLTFGTF